MFESISWQQFLSAVVLIGGGYYVITTLLLYGSEITTIFKQKERKQSASEINDDQNDSNESIDLMGKIKYDTEVNVPHENLITTEEIQVQTTNEDEEVVVGSPSDQADALIIVTIADLLEEIKTLADVLKDSSKEEAVLFFKAILSCYPQLIGTNYQEALSLFIYDSCKEHCQFDLTPNEIKSWWTEEEGTSTGN